MSILIDETFDTPVATEWGPAWTTVGEYGGASTDVSGGLGRLHLPAGAANYGAATYELHAGNVSGGDGLIETAAVIPNADVDAFHEYHFFTGPTLRNNSIALHIQTLSTKSLWRLYAYDTAGVATKLKEVFSFQGRGRTLAIKVRKSGGGIKFKMWDTSVAEHAAWDYEGTPAYTPTGKQHRLGLQIMEGLVPAGGYTVGFEYFRQQSVAVDTLPLYVVRSDGTLKGPLGQFVVKNGALA